jgi:uncharacterized membrane protein YdbT with pleckstrin-like domain
MQEDIQYGEDVQKLFTLLQQHKSLKDFKDAFDTPEDLEEFAKRAKIAEYDQGTQVIKQGERGTDFFIVLSGQLRAIDISHAEPHLLSYFVTGDIIGEGVILAENKTRTATVEVVIASKLACFTEDDWLWLITKNARIKTYFEDLERSRVARSAVDFPGRQWDEVVVAATKRHFIAYMRTLPVPLTLLIGPVLFFLAAEVLGLQFLTIVRENLTLLATLPFIIVAVLLMLYHYFDWRNDDFIVTTKRIVHIERILFYGEKRREAPLTRIQDVTLLSDILDLIFDSDTLRISTAGAGIIEFTHIRRADRIREVIFEERERAKARVAAADVAALRDNMAHQLNWDDELQKNVMAVAEPEAKLVHQATTHHYNRLIDYFIPRVREVNATGEGTVIIWHKHYYVLLTHIFMPMLALLASLYLFAASFLGLPFGLGLALVPVQIVLGVAVVASLVWYLWEYDDWQKDIYVVTDTQIIDIESTAFRLRRTRREGTFDNIQGVYSEIPNLFHKLLNLGDVIIETAGSEETFTFKKVFDPASVNEEVFKRWAIYQQREREKQRDATTDQVMHVLKEYHNLTKKTQ